MLARLGRRDALKLAAAAGASIWSTRAFGEGAADRATPASPRFSFSEIEHGVSESHVVAPGYDVEVLLRWGDAVVPGAPAFDPYRQTPAGQETQFGYNNDFTAFLPLGPDASRHGLLFVNHEYALPTLMFPTAERSRDTARIEMSAVGCSIVEIERSAGVWRVVPDSRYARRISGRSTPIEISGPAAAHERMKTLEDPTGRLVRGTISNCSGGMTPWGTCLTAEENFHLHFLGRSDADHREARNHLRYAIPRARAVSDWHQYFERWDTNRVLNEPNRFGWIVEVDPRDPASRPVKRTALGRFAHEGAAVHVNADGRVVVYMADDNRYEYLYRFVSDGVYDPGKRTVDSELLDEGTLSVAVFSDDGTLNWMPLRYGQGKINENNGFQSQADVSIETRSAADLLGATPMDRPEGIAIDPANGGVYVSLSGNKKRTAAQTDAANPREQNIWGHIIELAPPDGDHAAERFGWEMLVLCGPRGDAVIAAGWNPATSAHGWFARPDNCAFDPSGGFWVCSDQSIHWKTTSGTADGVWAVETEGALRATGKMFFRVPVGAEAAGPSFTPDGETLFLSVQHPGADGTQYYAPFGRRSSFQDPATRWPDFDPQMPPRPSVVAISSKGAGRIGS